MKKYRLATDEVMWELEIATRRYGKFASPHEGYGLLLEEVDELWDEVKKKPAKRSKSLMRNEACQVAAMAIRFMTDCC